MLDYAGGSEVSNRRMSTIGEQGEALVGAWLATKQAKVLHYRWRSQQAEVDIIAEKQDGTLLFIEVKTRSAKNWDTDGLLAITAKKKAKILQGSAMFLGVYPELIDRACRFDVALVRRIAAHQTFAGKTLGSVCLETGEFLHLIQYLPNAFDAL
jgi:putative endonuclease